MSTWDTMDPDELERRFMEAKSRLEANHKPDCDCQPCRLERENSALHAEVERLTHETTLREDRLREQVKELQQEITSLTSDNTSPAQEEIECDHNWVPTVGRSCTKCPEGFSHSVTEAETSIERIADLGLKLSLLREEVSDCLHRTYHYAPETHGNTLAAFSGTYEQVAMECERLRDEVERLKEKAEWRHRLDQKAAARFQAALGNGSDEEAWRPGHDWRDEVVRRLEGYSSLRAELDLLSAALIVRTSRLEKAESENSRLRDALGWITGICNSNFEHEPEDAAAVLEEFREIYGVCIDALEWKR